MHVGCTCAGKGSQSRLNYIKVTQTQITATILKMSRCIYPGLVSGGVMCLTWNLTLSLKDPRWCRFIFQLWSCGVLISIDLEVHLTTLLGTITLNAQIFSSDHFIFYLNMLLVFVEVCFLWICSHRALIGISILILIWICTYRLTDRS